MKKNNSDAKFNFVGYLLFFLPLAITVGFSVTIFFSLYQNGYSIGLISLFLLLYIAFATLIFALIDVVRRRIMIDKPVEQILKATEKIATGNFKVKLIPYHAYNKYDKYDIIMENINKMTVELSKDEVLKSEFISNVSHEIKTPLAIIQNYAKALHKEDLDKETKLKYLDTLVFTSQKLSDLVSNILKLNKLENQTIVSQKEKINIGELVRENVLQFENLFEKKSINLTCDIDDVEGLVYASYLEIIFNNLISNAIKFTNENGNIYISLKAEKECFVFSVKDTGCGISKEAGSRIFEKFYQADTSHSNEGNGLGLALVKKIIDIMGGEIGVESELGKGSTFVVKLKRNM